MEQVFADGKTFADCIPRRPPQDIVAEFQDQQKEPDFDLRKFVLDNFDLPENHPMPEIRMEKDIRKHIADLWPRLTRQADTVVKSGSLLPLPNPYIVPGGRFREVYYWDSYFTMLGLKVSGRVDLMEHMVNNFAYLIKTHGHIPNGNRTYYLSRSQPPFFGMMVALLAETKGDDKVYETYLNVLEKEYLYWMEGDKSLKPGQKSKRVVLTKEGYYLNRYFDERNDARPESYREDMLTANEGVTDVLAGMRFASEAAKDSFASKRKSVIFRNLRSGAESGWDFSSRWLSDAEKLYTLRVIHLIPVDLNCLLYFN
ncbi:MAG: alpha,alpha-trehalase, partial [Chitinophagaceae bacterium]|nr:alpha,alpha-trehalase [Chitinophagaceae bacterium]